MSTTRIALIGDYDPSVTAHQAILAVPVSLLGIGAASSPLSGRGHPLLTALVQSAGSG